MPGHFLQKSRHGSVYYFRRRVPDDLRTALGKHQLYKSLETCDRREAIIRARALAAKTDTLFAHIRTMPDKELPSLDYSMLIEFDDTHGKPKKIQIEADGREDQEAAQKAIDALLPALTSPHYEHANRTLPALGSWGDPPDLIRPRKTIREAINEYTERGDIKPTSRMSYRTKLSYLMELVTPDRDVYSITQIDLSEIAKRIRTDTSRSPTTQKDYITVIAGFLNWCRIGAGMSELTTKTLKPKSLEPASERRDAFTTDDTESLIKNAVQYKETEPHKFWVTLFTAFSGCRVEESSQINLHDDLIHDESADIWYIDLNERLGSDNKKLKSMKRHASWRKVPIHSALVRHGFVDFLLGQREAGYTRPFEQGWPPHVDEDMTKWSHKITKWGGNELKALREDGVVAGGKASYFHSWRHNLNDHLAKKNVPHEQRAALLGQQAGSSVNQEVYMKIKQDHVFLSQIVEANLTDYAALLETQLDESSGGPV